jgi:hypothetical protein
MAVHSIKTVQKIPASMKKVLDFFSGNSQILICKTKAKRDHLI